MGWTPVAQAEAVKEGEVLAIEAGGRQLALYRVEDVLYCTDNVCSHAYALLSDGWLEGTVIECPLHAGQFDICTGKGLGPPIDRDIAAYPVRAVADGIEVLLP